MLLALVIRVYVFVSAGGVGWFCMKIVGEVGGISEVVMPFLIVPV